MSASSASAISASTSSVEGLIVLKLWPWPSTNSPSTNRPYDGLMSTIARDSGAGAYSNGLRPSERPASVERRPSVELVETTVTSQSRVK